MKSIANLTITWIKPEIVSEEWEFTTHPAKQDYYHRHGITWEAIRTSFDNGILTSWPRGGEIAGVPVTGSHHSYDDYARYLSRAKRNYRINYSRMEEDLQRSGSLTLPAPIVLSCSGEALLFAGWRRLCLAWNYGMVPAVWLVPVAENIRCG